MSTCIASWGNSSAVRIPQTVLKNAGIRKGDRVNLVLNEKGRIEIVPEKLEHRRITPTSGITFASLFEGQVPEVVEKPESSWPDDVFVGAETEAWLS